MTIYVCNGATAILLFATNNSSEPQGSCQHTYFIIIIMDQYVIGYRYMYICNVVSARAKIVLQWRN